MKEREAVKEGGDEEMSESIAGSTDDEVLAQRRARRLTSWSDHLVEQRAEDGRALCMAIGCREWLEDVSSDRAKADELAQRRTASAASWSEGGGRVRGLLLVGTPGVGVTRVWTDLCDRHLGKLNDRLTLRLKDAWKLAGQKGLFADLKQLVERIDSAVDAKDEEGRPLGKLPLARARQIAWDAARTECIVWLDKRGL